LHGSSPTPCAGGGGGVTKWTQTYSPSSSILITRHLRFLEARFLESWGTGAVLLDQRASGPCVLFGGSTCDKFLHIPGHRGSFAGEHGDWRWQSAFPGDGSRGAFAGQSHGRRDWAAFSGGGRFFFLIAFLNPPSSHCNKSLA